MVGKNSTNLPPGFRFHPTDEELIMFYLRNQATSKPCPVSIIPEVDIYKFDPWQLPEKAEFGENEWYFFTPRDRKYPNGVRPNRAAVSGYWKATGTDKAIYSASKYVGIKKALVFYKGRPPKGIKTDWIMHEYRLNEPKSQPNKQLGSMRLDDWVLCRIYKKKNSGKVFEPKMEDLSDQTAPNDDANDLHHMKFPRNFSISQLWDLDALGPISQLLSDNSLNLRYDNPSMMSNISGVTARDIQLGEMPNRNYDSKFHVIGEMPNRNYDSKFHVNQGSMLNQPNFANPMFEFQ